MTSSKTIRVLRWAVPLAIVGLAAFLRLYRLSEVPPAFNFDEAAHATDALDILSGHHMIFSPKLQGVEAFFMYLVAGAFAVLGPSADAQRMVSALTGIATVGLTYLMVQEMFAGESERRLTWLAALAALGLATSFWHVNYSRIGLEVIMTAFFAAWCFYFLWRGLRTERTLDFALSGVGLGLAPYTHLPARLLPIPLVVFFALRWLIPSREAGAQRVRAAFWPSFRPLFIVGVAALVTYAPMGLYFILHPADFLSRSSVTSIFNPMMNKGDFWGTLWNSALGTFGGFGFTADSNWLANLPGKSILNPVLAALFWLGVLLALTRLRRPAYLFCLVAWATLLIPAIITPERTPHFSRMMITAPIVYIFPAIALLWLYDVLEGVLHLGQALWFTFSAPELRYAVGYPDPETSPPLQRAAAQAVRIGTIAAVALLFVLTSLSTYQDYFNVWARSNAHYMAFDGYAVELVELMKADQNPQATYILPRDIRAAEFYAHYTIDFLHRTSAPSISYSYIPMDEALVPQRLTEAVRGRNVVHLIRWKMDKHREADPKDYVTWLLERFGQRGETQSFDAYDVVTYTLPSTEVDFTPMPGYVPLGVDFGGKMQLAGATYGSTSARAPGDNQAVPSGGLIWLALQWKKEAPAAEDYRASVVLEDASGHVIRSVDRDLIHNWHMRTSGWPLAEAVSDYYLLPVPEGTPPGEYTLRAAVYQAETMQRLPVTGARQNAAVLAQVAVRPPDHPGEGGTGQPQHATEATWEGSLQLQGFDGDLSVPYSLGSAATLALYWHALSRPQADYLTSLRLRPRGSTEAAPVVLSPAARPLGDAYPTDRWRPGESWRGLYDLKVPPDAASGAHDLVLTISDARTGRAIGEAVLGEVTVAGRAHRYDLPPVGHPYSSTLDSQLRFLGYDLTGAKAVAGGALRLTLYWLPLRRMDTSYTVFVHLLDAAGRVVAQQDSAPAGGQAPTSGWLENEVIADSLEIPLSSELHPGSYAVEVGMYDPATGQRLKVEQAEQPPADRVLLEPVQVQ